MVKFSNVYLEFPTLKQVFKLLEVNSLFKAVTSSFFSPYFMSDDSSCALMIKLESTRVKVIIIFI